MTTFATLRSELRPAVTMLAVMSVLTGILYPLAITGISTTVFPRQSHGSLLVVHDTVRGSALVGQSFTSTRYLWGRPSAIALPYDARGSAGSNLGPTNPRLDTLVRARIAALRTRDADGTVPVPVDLVTASGSGLDPDITPAGAAYQVARIASARSLDPTVVTNVIASATFPRTFGILGEPRVNVLRANLALDSLSAAQAPRSSTR